MDPDMLGVSSDDEHSCRVVYDAPLIPVTYLIMQGYCWRRASSVLDCLQDPTEVVGERRTSAKATSTRDDTSHPLHQTVEASSSSFSSRLSHRLCEEERYLIIHPHSRQTV